MDIRASILVKGLVQGVGYRWFVNRNATSLGLKGFVENLYDGTVRVEVEGDRSLIEELVAKLKVGPRSAQVNDIRITWSEPMHDFKGFMIR